MVILKSILATLFNIATNLVLQFSYFGIFIGMTVESAAIPLPSEVIMCYAGFLVSKGEFQFWPVVIAGTLGNLVGSIILYYIGLKGGRTFVTRYGKYLHITDAKMARAENMFARYSDFTVFIARLLPVVRSFISLPAGILEVNFTKFIIFTLLGSFPWSIALTYVGMKLGDNWEEITKIMQPFQDLVIVALIIATVVAIYWKFFRKKKKLKEE